MSTWKILDEDFDKAKIMALGVGVCGGNIISNIADSGVNGIELVSLNTDSQEPVSYTHLTLPTTPYV